MAPRRPGWVLASALLVSGCATGLDRAEIIGAEYIVGDIRFEGVTRFDEETLIAHMALGESPWWPFAEPRYYNEGLIPADVERIESLYRAYGYYEAEVVAVRRAFRRDEVDLTFVIREGEPVIVRRRLFIWPDGPPRASPERPLEPEDVTRVAALEPGSVFEVARLNDSVADMRLLMRKAGFPFAEVEERAVVDPAAGVADVYFYLRSGPFARVGEVVVEGLEDVPRQRVLAEADFAVGRPFSPELLRRVEQAVFALDVFRIVTVLPVEEELGPDGTMPLLVRVVEAAPLSVRVGAGLAFEPNRWEERVRAAYIHRNLADSLTNLHLRALVGYAQLPSPFDPDETGPVVDLEPIFTKKGFLERGLIWTLAPRLEVGIEEGFQFYALRNRFGVARFFFGHLQVELGHHYRFFDFFDLTEAFDVNRTILGPDFRDPSTLSYLQLRNALYLTNDLVDPRNGLVLAVEYAIAGGPLQGDFNYHRIQPEARAYWTVHPRLQLASRARFGFILPYGDQAGAPIDQKFYLGGADTVRGFGLRRLSPQIPDCPPDEECRTIPVGGNTLVLFNFETRIRAFGPVWLVPFVDVGDVQAEEVEIAANQWNYAAGLGARYASPVGKIRADVGVRLNETERFVDEPRWTLHFGLGEAF